MAVAVQAPTVITLTLSEREAAAIVQVLQDFEPEDDAAGTAVLRALAKLHDPF